MLGKLILLKQTSLCEDQEIKNKSGKIVHVVVKNSPFTLTFGFNEGNFNSKADGLHSSFWDLHKYNLDVKLLYDANLEKEVDFVKDRPFAHKVSLNQSGTKLTVEVRIKVLTSQLEDMLFRVGIFATDSTSKHHFISYSEAVRVISKSDQVKKKQVIPNPSTSLIHPTPKKRDLADMLGDSLTQIEARQTEYSNLLRHLCEKNKKMLETSAIPPKAKKPVNLDFTSCFSEFLQVFSAIPSHEERRTKIRKIMAMSPSSQVASVAELSDLFMAEGLSRELGDSRPLQPLNVQTTVSVKNESPFCSCLSCPYKKRITSH